MQQASGTKFGPETLELPQDSPRSSSGDQNRGRGTTMTPQKGTVHDHGFPLPLPPPGDGLSVEIATQWGTIEEGFATLRNSKTPPLRWIGGLLAASSLVTKFL